MRSAVRFALGLGMIAVAFVHPNFSKELAIFWGVAGGYIVGSEVSLQITKWYVSKLLQ